MLRDEFDDAGRTDPDRLRAAYETHLAETVESVGREAALSSTDLDERTLDRLLAGEAPELTLEEAASLLALDPDRPDADAIAAEARDILLMGMTTAVVDVDTLASQIDDALEPKEIQQKVEGRFPMTLAEYALIHHELAGER